MNKKTYVIKISMKIIHGTPPPLRHNQPQQMFISERHLCGVCVVISENMKKNHDMWETDERLYPHTAVRKENNARKLSEEEEN